MGWNHQPDDVLNSLASLAESWWVSWIGLVYLPWLCRSLRGRGYAPCFCWPADGSCTKKRMAGNSSCPTAKRLGETMENGLMMAGLIHGSHRGICHKKGAQTDGVSAADQWIDLVQQGSVHDLTDPRSTSEWFPLPSSVENCVKAISISFIFPLSWRNFIWVTPLWAVMEKNHVGYSTGNRHWFLAIFNSETYGAVIGI